jgi:hypothetical protein
MDLRLNLDLYIPHTHTNIQTQLVQLEAARAELAVAKEELRLLQRHGGDTGDATEETKEEEPMTESICTESQHSEALRFVSRQSTHALDALYDGPRLLNEQVEDGEKAPVGAEAVLVQWEAEFSQLEVLAGKLELHITLLEQRKVMVSSVARAGTDGEAMGGGGGGGGGVSQENVVMKIVEEQKRTESKLTKIVDEKESGLAAIVEEQQQAMAILRETESALRGGNSQKLRFLEDLEYECAIVLTSENFWQCL